MSVQGQTEKLSRTGVGRRRRRRRSARSKIGGIDAGLDQKSKHFSMVSKCMEGILQSDTKE